jgi:hypothetical protein
VRAIAGDISLVVAGGQLAEHRVHRDVIEAIDRTARRDAQQRQLDLARTAAQRALDALQAAVDVERDPGAGAHRLLLARVDVRVDWIAVDLVLELQEQRQRLVFVDARRHGQRERLVVQHRRVHAAQRGRRRRRLIEQSLQMVDRDRGAQISAPHLELAAAGAQSQRAAEVAFGQARALLLGIERRRHR